MVYYTWFMGSTTLSYFDSWGEKLAWWFGITSPKYYYEIQEFERMKEEEEEEERQRKVNEHGWSNVSFPEDHTNPSSEQPKIELQGYYEYSLIIQSVFYELTGPNLLIR